MTGTEPLRVHGRPARIAVLVNNEVSTDNRVLKTSATLRGAGAAVAIVGTERTGYPAGQDVVGEGLSIHRTRALDLVRLLPWLARTVRRARAWRRGRPATTTATGSATSPPPPTAPRVTRPMGARAVAADLWMRAYQVARLVTFWLGAVQWGLRTRPDVVHANDGNTLAPALALRALTGARIVYDAHELWTGRNVRQDRPVAPLVEAALERLGVRAADGVITVSPSIVTWMQRRFRLSRTPTLVRNIPVGTGAVPAPSGGRMRELAGLSPDDAVISYCGGVTTGRGLEDTVAALTELEDHVHLVMLGFGAPEYVAGLRRTAEALGVGDRVHLVGPVPGPMVPAALADSDVAVVYVRPICLSYEYSLPNKLFESIHAGLPIVAADLPDTAALVREHGVGEVFGVGDAAGLARAIAEVLADPAGYRAASWVAAAALDWEHEAQRLLALYADVLRAVSR